MPKTKRKRSRRTNRRRAIAQTRRRRQPSLLLRIQEGISNRWNTAWGKALAFMGVFCLLIGTWKGFIDVRDAVEGPADPRQEVRDQFRQLIEGGDWMEVGALLEQIEGKPSLEAEHAFYSLQVNLQLPPHALESRPGFFFRRIKPTSPYYHSALYRVSWHFVETRSAGEIKKLVLSLEEQGLRSVFYYYLRLAAGVAPKDRIAWDDNGDLVLFDEPGTSFREVTALMNEFMDKYAESMDLERGVTASVAYNLPTDGILRMDSHWAPHVYYLFARRQHEAALIECLEDQFFATSQRWLQVLEKFAGGDWKRFHRHGGPLEVLLNQQGRDLARAQHFHLLICHPPDEWAQLGPEARWEEIERRETAIREYLDYLDSLPSRVAPKRPHIIGLFPHSKDATN